MAEDAQMHLLRVRIAYEASMWTETLDIQVISRQALPAAWLMAPVQTLPAVLFWYIAHFGNYGEASHCPHVKCSQAPREASFKYPAVCMMHSMAI